MKKIIYIIFIWLVLTINIQAQNTQPKESNLPKKNYKKRVLQSIEMDILSSMYTQDGDNAAVSGGIGTESLQDATATIIVSIPLNDDDVLVIDAGVSAYTSASSSNVNPWDSRRPADAFVASSGESQSDVWSSVSLNYSHSSDDRNKVYSGNVSFATEYDYTSIGAGGSFSTLFNEKNSEFNIKASVYFDKWGLLYPSELRSFGLRGDDDDDEYFNIDRYTIIGNTNYAPQVLPLTTDRRNSYAMGFGFSQILSNKLQASVSADLVMQSGQLSTPFQRVYFQDVENSYIENFHLADDIERLPSNRFKAAIGGRLHYYVNEFISLRSFYRYYQDDWNLKSHTASLEIPVKFLLGQWTFYPSYRFYQQSGMEYFAPYNDHLFTSKYYTSDYDLSDYNAHQLGFGISYNDVFDKAKLWIFDLSNVDLKYYRYNRNSNFNSHLLTLGIKIKF